MKDARVYVRLSREEKERLVVLSAPYGGVSNWILAQLGKGGCSKGLVKTPVVKEDRKG